METLVNGLKHESCLSQEVLRGEDRHLLRLAGILHDDAGSGGCGGTGLFHLWIQDSGNQHVEVCSVTCTNTDLK